MRTAIMTLQERRNSHKGKKPALMDQKAILHSPGRFDASSLARPRRVLVKDHPC
jgi:hypothetical protein